MGAREFTSLLTTDKLLIRAARLPSRLQVLAEERLSCLWSIRKGLLLIPNYFKERVELAMIKPQAFSFLTHSVAVLEISQRGGKSLERLFFLIFFLIFF